MNDDIKTSAEAMESVALPDAWAVHLDPDSPKTPEQMPLPKKVQQKPVEQKTPAEWAYERIVLYIQNFEKTLDGEHEVAMGFTGSDAGIMRIEGMGFFAPDILTFYGTDPGGVKSQLIQHVSQLNVVLRAMPKAVQSEPAQRIGFRLAADLEDEAAEQAHS